MIYTIGHRENYLKNIERYGTIQKLGRLAPGVDDRYPEGYPGGYAFKTLEDAQRGLIEENPSGTWAVFGIEADWDQDTAPDSDGWWHSLLKDADIIVLPETTQ